MKKEKISLATCFFLLFLSTSMFAQKKVAAIEKIYEKERYRLAINKINKLKPEYQSLRNVQLMLADSYWQTGDNDRSIQLYQRVANNFTIPDDFKEKFFEAIDSDPRKVYSPDKTLGSKGQTPGLTSKAFVSKIEDQGLETDKKINVEKETFGKKTELAAINEEKSTDQFNSKSLTQEKCISVSPTEHKCIQVPSASVLTSTKTNSQMNLPANGIHDNNALYRIRVGAFADMKNVKQSDFESFGEVDIKEWANKKIVFVGFFNSVETAKKMIDDFFKKEYKNAVVVKKENGRYRKVTFN